MAISSSKFKYLPRDKGSLWGVTVDTVGKSSIGADFDVYPLTDRHPKEYYFDIEKGRILNNYLILYITQGKGHVWFSKEEEPAVIEGGTILIIPPPSVAQLLS